MSLPSRLGQSGLVSITYIFIGPNLANLVSDDIARSSVLFISHLLALSVNPLMLLEGLHNLLKDNPIA